MSDARLWLPFVAIGFVKFVLLTILARIDWLPHLWLAAILTVFPDAQHSLRYPELMMNLPQAARHLDLILFLTLGAVAQGWAIVQLVEGWTGSRLALCPTAKRGAARLGGLMVISGLIVLVPFVVRQAAGHLTEPHVAMWLALSVGLLGQVLLFCAPAFRIIDDYSILNSIRRSAELFRILPVALPLCILLLAALHAPAILLRNPLIAAGAVRDPEWIWWALLIQIPVDIVGAFVAVAISTRLRLSNVVRRSLAEGRGAHV